jgi:hypothetical protein
LDFEEQEFAIADSPKVDQSGEPGVPKAFAVAIEARTPYKSRRYIWTDYLYRYRVKSLRLSEDLLVGFGDTAKNLGLRCPVNSQLRKESAAG